MRESPAEVLFAIHCREKGLRFEREVAFHPKRKWRVDFLFPRYMLAVEIEGGTWSNGRHTRGKGFAADIAKYNALTKMGYRLLRYTTEMVLDGTAIADVLEALK